MDTVNHLMIEIEKQAYIELKEIHNNHDKFKTFNMSNVLMDHNHWIPASLICHLYNKMQVGKDEDESGNLTA